MIVKMQCTVFYGDNFVENFVIPNDMKFTEMYRYKRDDGKFESQRFYISIYDKDDFVKESLAKQLCGRVSVYDFDSKMIVEVRQCAPINEDLPLISIDELNEQYSDFINQYYIKSIRLRKDYEALSREIFGSSIIDLNENIINDMIDEVKNRLKTLTNILSTTEQYYTEYIAHPLSFTFEGEDISMKCGVVYFKSWLNDQKIIDNIEIINIKLSALLSSDYWHGQKIIISKDLKDEYKNRLTEICNKC